MNLCRHRPGKVRKETTQRAEVGLHLFEFRSLRVGHLIHVEAALCFDLKAVNSVGWIAMFMDTFRTGKMLVHRDVVAQAGQTLYGGRDKRGIARLAVRVSDIKV